MRLPSPLRPLTTVLFVLCLFSLLPAAGTRAEPIGGTAGYQAANWDKETILPPGSYRATKPVDINGGFMVKTQPGTQIEGVNFLGRSGVQHWHIEGTLLRRCNIAVKMNGNGHIIDSALEDCDFYKDDNWFMFWWSMHWRFDNCVFTKRAVHAAVLGPVDYSVQARRCTFYGIKLPPVGFKEDPSKYMGKEDIFEKCRFVDCDVPQSFLACTIDCVFEGCRFEPKNKLQWPKETGSPIKVHAYYAAGGSEPASFVNGPLSVEFERAPMNGEFGSTLVHTQSGGRITLTNLHLPDQPVSLGIVPKKASEIVEVAAATPTPAATPNAAPAVAVAPAVHNLEELLRALPSNIEVMSHGLPNPAGVEAANSFLSANYVGKGAALRMGLASTLATTDEDYAYQAAGRPQGLLYHGATIPSNVVAMFRAANVAPLAKAAPNSEIAVRGIVRQAAFVGRGTTLGFTLVLGESQIVDTLAILAPPPLPAADAAGEAQVVGAWTVLVHWDAGRREQTFNADHSCTSEGRRFAAWDIKDNRFNVRFPDGGVDAYDLPVRDGVMYGRNLKGWQLTLTRPGTPMAPAVQAQVVGQWVFTNFSHPGVRVFKFAADRSVRDDDDKLIAHWLTLGTSLVLEWEGHPEWHDMFDLPGVDGIVRGRNGYLEDLTLAHHQEAAAPPKSPAAGKGKSTYFGSEVPK